MLNLLRPMLNSFSATLVAGRNVMAEQVRFNRRWYFERCSEIKRIRKFGYKTRMSTPNGRAIIMRRILKGRHILTH